MNTVKKNKIKMYTVNFIWNFQNLRKLVHSVPQKIQILMSKL